MRPTSTDRCNQPFQAVWLLELEFEAARPKRTGDASRPLAVPLHLELCSRAAKVGAMAEICEYFYTEGGLRFETGSGVVRLTIDGEERELRVVRNGKGRSRLEDGEITLRDIEAHVREGATVPVEFLLDGERVTLALDPRNAMGERGRVQSAELSKVAEGLSTAARAAVARTQIETLPYGVKNADESLERLRWALEQGELTGVSRDALCNVAQILDEDATMRIITAQPELASKLVFGLARGTADAELLTNTTPAARNVLAREGCVMINGVVPAFRGLDQETIADLRDAGATIDRTHGALVGDVPLSTWVLTREALITTSGTPWSLSTTLVRDENGDRVKDASRLDPGATVSVAPKWTKDTSTFVSFFTVTETVGAALNGSSGDARATDPTHAAVWRSQGGALDVYSRLPGSTLRSVVGSLSDAELSQALAWASPRDFAALSEFSRTAEHNGIAALRFDSEIAADAITFGNALWNDPVDAGESKKLEHASRASLKSLEELRKAVAGERRAAEELFAQMSRGMRPEALSTHAAQGMAALVRQRDAAVAVTAAAASLDELRADWFSGVAEVVRHDDDLRERVASEARAAGTNAGAERRGLLESCDALEYSRKQLEQVAELSRTGNFEGARDSVRKVVGALEQAERAVASSVRSSTELIDAMDYGAEERRTSMRREDLRHERGLIALSVTPVLTGGALLSHAIVTGTDPGPLPVLTAPVRWGLLQAGLKIAGTPLNRRMNGERD